MKTIIRGAGVLQGSGAPLFRPITPRSEAKTEALNGVSHRDPRLIADALQAMLARAMEGSTIIDLRLGDCIEGLRHLEPESVDAVVTSPPYNLGVRYSRFRDDGARSAYLDWSQRWAMEVQRVLKRNGALYLNIGAVPANPLLPHQIALRLSEIFVLQNTIHWVKSIAIERRNGESLAVGHFKPLNSPRYLSDCHEYIFQFTKEGDVPIERLAIGVPYADKSNISRWNHTGGRDRRCRGNNWFIPYHTIRNRASERPHPATFPVELATMCLRLHGVTKESVVLDPFLGLGNSAIAARECGVGRFVGFEIDAGYLAEAQVRVSPMRLACLERTSSQQ